MFGFLKRIFRIGKAEANAALDNIENPITMTQEGIRELQKDLESSLSSLAEVKALAIRTNREAEEKQQEAADYDAKARALLTKAKDGGLDLEEAKRLAGEALNRRETALKAAKDTAANATKYNSMAANLQSKIGELKSKVESWQNELRTLKARHEVSQATAKINKQFAEIDSSDTLAMLERMKEKVEEKEALSESYAELANATTSIDHEIDKALEGTKGNASLDNLLLELGMKERHIELPPAPDKLLTDGKEDA